MPLHAIKRGLDIPIRGAATGSPVQLDLPSTVAVDPREFHGVIPRLAARPGDTVARGDVLFYDKRRPSIVYRSPVAGTVSDVQRGRRRVITAIVVDVQGQATTALDTLDADATPEAKREWLLASGLWMFLRTRPLDLVPEPTAQPQGILVYSTDTGPLQPSAAQLLHADAKAHVQRGIDVLRGLTTGAVWLSKQQGQAHPALAGLSGVQEHTFMGPHPSGDAAVQVNYIAPPTGGGQVWAISAWDVARIGELASTGQLPNERVYAAVGAGMQQPRFVRTVIGAPVAHILGEAEGENRYIRGSVLTGNTTDYAQWGGALKSTIHVLPSHVPRFLQGWATPRLDAFSSHRLFLSGFIGAKNVDIRPGLHGGHREQVPVHSYRRVIATPDIHPEFLLKAMQAGDLVESVNLGMLDLSMEEAALCTFVCPSKLEFDVVLQNGLDLYVREA